jgi:CRP-like cAMP-binding protein
MLVTTENRKLINCSPVFSGLSEDVLREVLEKSQLKNYKKRAVVFSEGDKVVNYYIVLRGWVKLFQINEEGKEAVLQVVGANDGILETAALFDDNFSVTAGVAVKNTEILAVPSLTFWRYVKDDQAMANNTLAVVTQQSQKLRCQLSCISLKTPQQRVGGFLLNLFLQNKPKTNALQLPYDKSLIASHLGMRLETFSRNLHELKQNNKIIIKKNIIILRDVSFLCDYCDNENRDQCDLKRHK